MKPGPRGRRRGWIRAGLTEEKQLFREQGKGKEKHRKEHRNSELWRRELT